MGVFIKKEYIIYIAFAVIVVIGVVAYLALSASSGSNLIGKQVSSSQIQELQQIADNTTLANNVGYGLATPGVGSNLPKIINGTAYVVDGKPAVLYVGGEFCPYCAITRWSLIIALMRFGTFSNLTYMQSSSTDVYADTPTFSFVNSSYSSSAVSFEGREITDRSEQPINSQNLTGAQLAIYDQYSAGSIPFVDFENKSLQSGAMVTPSVLHGMGWGDVIGNLSNQNSVQAQAVIGSADVFTAFICKGNMTLNTTSSVCQQSYVKKILQG